MDVEHLVEHSRNMKAYSIHAIKLGSGFHFLFRQPFLVGECKFKFVTIESRMFGTLDREYFFHFDLTDPGQVVDHLLVFVANLFLIGQMLPFTATAYAEMFTERLCTLGRIFMEKYSFPFRITMFLACQLYVYDISGSNKRYEYDHVIYACDSLSFCGYICYCYLF